MDSDGPTTGKPTSQFLRDVEGPSLIDKVMHRWRTWLVVLAVAIVGIYYLTGRSSTESAVPPALAHPSVPVAAVPAKLGDLKQYITAIGTVTAYNTVTVKSRVDGELIKVNFTEGQIVKAGDLLAEIDPRPYQVELTQAEGTLAKDEATLENAKILLCPRQGALPTENYRAAGPRQSAGVGWTVRGLDRERQGRVDNAKLQLTYSRITAPITGRVGLRLVDPGNIVHATDTTGLAVITQLQPIAVDFTIPEDDLPSLVTAMKANPQLPVAAYDRDLKHKLADGALLTIDNQIDHHRHDQAEGRVS